MKEENKKDTRIIHIMADGSVRDSVKGYPVPEDNQAYLILAKWISESGRCSNRVETH